MGTLLKPSPLVALFQDVLDKVKEAGEAQRSWYLQRTVIGAIIALVAGGSASFAGFKIDQPIQDQLSDNLTQMVTAASTVYGIVLSLYGGMAKLYKRIRGN